MKIIALLVRLPRSDRYRRNSTTPRFRRSPFRNLVDCIGLTLVRGANSVSDVIVILSQNIDRAVRTSPIHHNVFKIRISLQQNGSDRLLDETSVVVARRDNGDTRPGFTRRTYWPPSRANRSCPAEEQEAQQALGSASRLGPCPTHEREVIQARG